MGWEVAGSTVSSFFISSCSCPFSSSCVAVRYTTDVISRDAFPVYDSEMEPAVSRASVSSSASTVPESPTLPLPLSRGDREALAAMVAVLQVSIDTLRAMEPVSHADLDDYRSAILDDLEYHVRRQARRFQ